MRTYANPFLIVCAVWSLVLGDGLSMVHGAEEKSTVTVEEVFSFFHKYCTVCHDEKEAKGGLVLEELESLLDIHLQYIRNRAMPKNRTFCDKSCPHKAMASLTTGF